MFSEKIKFECHPEYLDLVDDRPIPAIQNVPEWFKKLNPTEPKHTKIERTIKSCMPFLDSLTMGYILKTPQQIVIDIEKKDDVFQGNIDYIHSGQDIEKYNLVKDTHWHNQAQVYGAPFLKKNYNLPIMKILNPWKIITPKGYSTLFVPPLNNADDRFSIIPGIVDTDKHSVYVNFPSLLNADKYPNGINTVIERGTPYVQLIPFKRDSWKMEVGPMAKKSETGFLDFALSSYHYYKDKVWSKKTCK